MYPGEQFDIQPGISAVVLASAGQKELDAAMDEAAKKTLKMHNICG